MNTEAGTITSTECCHSISLCRPRNHAFPVDYHVDIPIERLAMAARTAYLVSPEDPESAVCLEHGRHYVRSDRHMIVLEDHHRFFLSPPGHCILDYDAGQARLTVPDGGFETMPTGVRMRMPPIETSAGIEALFEAVSRLCSTPGETSPYRSHPLYRDLPPDIVLSHEPSCMPSGRCESPIRIQLPPDLRFLYAAAPLAYYLGASVETGDRPCVETGYQSIDLPQAYRHFERWAGKMLSHTFQADCAVRCEAALSGRLRDVDIHAITGYAPEELMLMTMPDRFRIYCKTLSSGRRAFNTWHMASYVEPVPSSVELLPFLMRSLSAVYAPKSARVTERDVITLSVRGFGKPHAGYIRGEDEPDNVAVLPSLYNAQSQHWYSEGCPVDAALSGLDALKNGRSYARSRLMPEICVIVNEAPLEKEAQMIKDLLKGSAPVEVRTDLTRADLLHTFSEGFDVVHFAGHCDRYGLKCRDGAADLSSVGTCNVPVFFLNSCASYLQGARLIEKGAVCGIATMFRLLDQAAMDVSTAFYRMLARGYPIMTSFLGARECSVTGKEYLLIGDGFYHIFNGRSPNPFYKLTRSGNSFSIQCKMPGGEKGLIIRAGSGQMMADTGFEITGIPIDDLPVTDVGPDGMCLYSAAIYDSVAEAVRAVLIDRRRELMTRSHAGRSTGARKTSFNLVPSGETFM